MLLCACSIFAIVLFILIILIRSLSSQSGSVWLEVLSRAGVGPGLR